MDDESVARQKLDLKSLNLKDHYVDVIFLKNRIFLVITGVDNSDQIRLIIKQLNNAQEMTDVCDIVITSSCNRIDPRTKVYKVFKNYVYFYVI